MNRLLYNIVLALATIAMWGWISKMDFEDAKTIQEYHCELVSEWEDDAAMGIPPERRRGNPDYNNSCNR